MPKTLVVIFALLQSAAWAGLAPAVLAAQGAPAAASAAAAAPGIANLGISGKEVTASLDLQGIHADLTFTFEQVVGLSAANLGLSAQLVDPHDAALVRRLPAGGLVTVPGAFPVLVRVQPPPSGGLSFSGIYTLALHTYNLEMTGGGCPLRLLSAPAGGAFQDITANMGTGSYRVRGTRGTFSDFLIVADIRRLGDVVALKFDAINDMLAAFGEQIPDAMLADLKRRIREAQADYQEGSAVKAAQDVAAFAETVRSQSGAAIPDVWRASGDLHNSAGQLRAAAGTLAFSLGLAPAALAAPAAPAAPAPGGR